MYVFKVKTFVFQSPSTEIDEYNERYGKTPAKWCANKSTKHKIININDQ